MKKQLTEITNQSNVRKRNQKSYVKGNIITDDGKTDAEITKRGTSGREYIM